MTPNSLPPGSRPGIETRLAAAGHDADQILRTLDIEIALNRAGRKLKGPGQLQAMRLLSVAMLFFLLVVALGAMFYLQTQYAGHPSSHRAPAATTDPAPGPSTPAVGPDRQSAPPTH